MWMQIMVQILLNRYYLDSECWQLVIPMVISKVSCKNTEYKRAPMGFLPRDMRSDVASRLSQKDTQERTTSSMQGPYTWIKKLPMFLWR